MLVGLYLKRSGTRRQTSEGRYACASCTRQAAVDTRASWLACITHQRKATESSNSIYASLLHDGLTRTNARYTPLTRFNSRVTSRRRCVLGFNTRAVGPPSLASGSAARPVQVVLADIQLI